jgi:hypothetical protein
MMISAKHPLSGLKAASQPPPRHFSEEINRLLIKRLLQEKERRIRH